MKQQPVLVLLAPKTEQEALVTILGAEYQVVTAVTREEAHSCNKMSTN